MTGEPGFVTAAERYCRSDGWTTEQNQISESVYAIACVNDQSEYGLFFVVPDRSTEVSEDVISEAVSMAEANGAEPVITARGGYTDAARRTAEAADVEIVPPAAIEEESVSFDHDISMPDPETGTDEGPTDAGTTAGAPADSRGNTGTATDTGTSEPTAPAGGGASGREGRFAGDGETLEVEQVSRLGDSTKHYNTDNIAFFQSIDISVTLLGKLFLYVFPIVAAAFVAIQFNRPLVAAVVFLVTFLPQWYFMRLRDRAVIGTFSSNDRIASNELDTLESLFKQSASNLITIAGSKTRLLWNLDYRHHLVPENIVSVQRASRVRGKLYFLMVFVVLLGTRLGGRFFPLLGGYVSPQTAVVQVVVLTVVVYAIEMGYVTLPVGGDGILGKSARYAGLAFVVVTLPTIARSPGQIVYLVSEPRYALSLVVTPLFIGGVLGVLLRGTRDAVLVQLQGGEDKVFVMSEGDAERVVSEFGER